MPPRDQTTPRRAVGAARPKGAMTATLAAEGFLEQLPNGAYRLAPKVFTLGFSALRSLTSCNSPRGRRAGSSRRPGRRRT
ncbi:hypothetical protein ABT299_16550 [Spirillospora sp. NPDC000708]